MWVLRNKSFSSSGVNLCLCVEVEPYSLRPGDPINGAVHPPLSSLPMEARTGCEHGPGDSISHVIAPIPWQINNAFFQSPPGGLRLTLF